MRILKIFDFFQEHEQSLLHLSCIVINRADGKMDKRCDG